MPASSFAQTKQLRITLILAQQGNVFPGTESNTLILTGLRMSARIQAVRAFASHLELDIYGMREQDMNALTVLRWGPNPSTTQNNIVQVEANGGDGWQIVFSGTIVEGYPDYRSMPDACFHIQAVWGYYQGISATPPLSYPQGVNAATAAQAIASSMGYGFQNNGVNAQLPPGTYLCGAPIDQLNSLARMAQFDYYTASLAVPTVVICQKNTPLTNAPIIQLSPQSGMVGYPRIDTAGISFECLFNPAITSAGLVQISGSKVPAANGLWMPFALFHELETIKAGGSWFSSIKALWQAPA